MQRRRAHELHGVECFTLLAQRDELQSMMAATRVRLKCCGGSDGEHGAAAAAAYPTSPKLDTLAVGGVRTRWGRTGGRTYATRRHIITGCGGDGCGWVERGWGWDAGLAGLYTVGEAAGNLWIRQERTWDLPGQARALGKAGAARAAAA